MSKTDCMMARHDHPRAPTHSSSHPLSLDHRHDIAPLGPPREAANKQKREGFIIHHTAAEVAFPLAVPGTLLYIQVYMP